MKKRQKNIVKNNKKQRNMRKNTNFLHAFLDPLVVHWNKAWGIVVCTSTVALACGSRTRRFAFAECDAVQKVFKVKQER